ncbi:hypothetical protein CPB86DRAFT_797375 [Serendipita vermifera]|nr:hypothetical protein CPB86DRAFT_797375 [Serendipita vermifera]
MPEGNESAISRVPREIWWAILEEAISQYNPLFFSTVFNGSSWSKYSSWRSFAVEDFWRRRNEKNRKIIGSVCRSWQAFARSRRGRYFALKLDGRGELFQGIEGLPNARRVGLHHGVCQKLVEFPHLTQGFNWKIIEISQEDVQELALIPLPLLRRVQINSQRGFLLGPFLDGLSKFMDITWLEYEAFNPRDFIPIDIQRAPIVLPNLQTLWFKLRGTFEFSFQLPFRYLILPSLRFLSFHMGDLPVQVSLIDIISPYRQTLRPFTARVSGSTGRLPPIQFPPWNAFPELEELAVDRPWIINFHPLPSKHPLRSLEAQHAGLDTISSFVRGENMQEILLQRTRWAHDGRLTGEHEKMVMDKPGVDRLLAEAEVRRIAVKVSWDGRNLQPRRAPKPSSG